MDPLRNLWRGNVIPVVVEGEFTNLARGNPHPSTPHSITNLVRHVWPPHADGMRSFLIVLALASVAHSQINCATELTPFKPLGLMCSNAVVSCACQSTGQSCHWVWGCPDQPAASFAPAFNTIPMTAIPNVGKAVMEAFRTGQEIQNLKMQTELLKQQTEALRLQNQMAAQSLQVPSEPAQPGAPPSSLFQAPTPVPIPTGALYTGGYLNGYAWKGFSARERIIYLQSMMEGMVDVGVAAKSIAQVGALFPDSLTPAEIAVKLDAFYTPGSEPIMIVNALRILAKERAAEAARN